MAIFKVFTKKYPASPSFFGCFNWCFKGGQDDGAARQHHELPTTPEENGKKGNAYAYDEQDTSSDSDDEVLRRYQQNLQRVPSQRSVRSGRSHKSGKSGQSGQKKDGPEQDNLMSLAEKGGKEGGSSEEGSPAEESDNELATSVKAASVVSKKSGVGSVGEEGKSASVSGNTQSQSYKNEAFQEDAVGSPDKGSQGSSEQALSGFGDSASMSVADVDHDEHLFDVSDLQDREPVLISKCGSLEVTFGYSFEKSRMTVTVHQAREIPTKDRGGANNTQVRLLLLPTKKVRHKTKIKPGENPDFQETFTFKVPPEELNNMGVRFRLYGCERMRRERMIGESVVGFASLNHDTETTHWLTLEPRSNLSHGDSKLDVSSLSRSDSASSTQSMQHGGMPELLIGLAYNGTTGRLSVEVIKGSNFRNMAMNRAPDTYVKLTLMSPNGQEIARSKTSIRRGQPNPLYKETFMFQVALFQLPDVTLMVSVYNKRSMKRKEMIGWFSLGLNNSGDEELSHWNDMRESKGEQVCRWHVLLES